VVERIKIMKKILIHSGYIKLDQFLKLSDCVSTGGMAKALLQEGHVLVNGEKEERRGRKLYPGDRVEVQDEGSFEVIGGEPKE
jgi:ribosome-associated protein